MAHEPGNQTPNTPRTSETALRDKTVEELQDVARDAGVDAPSTMRKEELVRAVVAAHEGSAAHGQRGQAHDMGAGPDGGRVRTGPESSSSLQYSQEITSTGDEPERPGRSLATTHHDVIRDWAERRGAVPATVEGTEHGDHLGVLRFDFGGDDAQLRHVSWEEWFETFDARRLNFIYQEERSDGQQSNFFRLENPDREDG
jgi:hypothetical protein